MAIARMVADGCGRLRPSSERTLNPQTPRVKRERLLRIPEKVEFDMLVLSPPPSPSIGVGNLPERNRRTGEV